MVGVSRRVEPGRQMALGADLVAGCAQLQAMRIMAVGAGHASLEHPALQEGAILVVLLLDLPIGKVDAGAEQAWHRAIEEWMTISEGFSDFVPSAWQKAQVSISPFEVRGAVRAAVPTAGSKTHRPPPVSARKATRPFALSSGMPVGDFAQAAWREPGPWQASQETSSSDHVE